MRLAHLPILILTAFAMAASSADAAAPQVFRVADYGATADDTADDTAAIQKAIQAAVASKKPAQVVLDAGTYHVHGDREGGYCFTVTEAADLTIRGAGAPTRLIVTRPDVGVFYVGACNRVVLRDFTVDYDPVPFCQGTIRAVNPQEGWFDLDVAPGYLTPDAPNFLHAHEPYGKWGMIIDPATRRIRAGTIDHFMTPRWEHREGRVYRFFVVNSEHYRWGLTHMRSGDSYVHLARGFASAILGQACDGIRIENVTIHASPSLAVGLVGNRGEIVVRGLQVRFPQGSDRLLTTDADGVHCQQNRSGPIIEGSYFEGMADDAVNIYAPPNVLLQKPSADQWLVSAACFVAPGDRLQVLDPRTGLIKGIVTARKVTPQARAFLIELDRPLPEAAAGTNHRDADTLYNLDACGAGFRIRKNRINGNRRYGCLLRAHSGVVEDNTFVDMTGAGVVVINEPDWPEGPVPYDIVIRRNRFVRGGTCKGYADADHGQVVVRGPKLGFGLADQPIVRGIRVVENKFEEYLGLGLYVGAADGVSIERNTFTAKSAERLRSGPVLLVERSRQVVLAQNQVTDRRAGVTCAVELRPDVAAGSAGFRMTGTRADLPEGVPLIRDLRE